MKQDNPPKKVLILHLSRLGDMIQSLPAIKGLKEADPECGITFMGIEEFCVLLRGSPWIDRLVTIPVSLMADIKASEHTVDRGAMDRLLSGIPELNESYDLIVNMTHNASSGYLTSRIRAAVKSGRGFSVGSEIMVHGTWGKYLFALSRNREDNVLNLVDIYMGMSGVPIRPQSRYLASDPETDRLCRQVMDELGYDSGRTAVGFQLGASTPARMWPIENFISLAERLRSGLNAQIILFGSPGERHLAERFRSQADFPYIDLIGKPDLRELPSYLKMLSLLVSNDTGPMHIAAAAGVTVVGIFSSSAFYSITGPYGAGHVVVQAETSCAPCPPTAVCARPVCSRSISPQTVFRAVHCALRLEPPIENDSPAGLYRSYFHPSGTCRYEPIAGERQGFSGWLASMHYIRAGIQQALWGEWLGLGNGIHIKADPDLLHGELDRFRENCRAYRSCYARGKSACRKIISEFKSKRPRIEQIQAWIAELNAVEQEIRDLEGPMDLFKPVHEFLMTEIEMCNFPELSKQFSRQYSHLEATIGMFERVLEKLD